MTTSSRQVEFAERCRYPQEILIADGISRAGKFLLGNIVSGFTGVEFLQYSYTFDTLPYLQRLGKLSADTCRILLQTEVDYCTYSRMTGRYLNTRVIDLSCIYRAPELHRYLARSNEPDDGKLSSDFTAEGRTSLFVTHEAVCFARIYFEAIANAKMIHILRDPAAVLMSWYKRGWGKRFGCDPKTMAISFRGIDNPVPWYALDWAEDYDRFSEMDRVVKSVHVIVDQARAEYQSLDKKAKAMIHFIRFEDLMRNPQSQAEKLSKFLNRAPLPELSSIFARERLPRTSEHQSRETLLQQIRALLSPDLHSMLTDLIRDYDEFWTPLAAPPPV